MLFDDFTRKRSERKFQFGGITVSEEYRKIYLSYFLSDILRILVEGQKTASDSLYRRTGIKRHIPG